MVCLLSIQAGSSESQLRCAEVPLGELRPHPFTAFVNEVVRQSWDYRHVAFAAREGDRMVVYVDGERSREYDSAGAVLFGPAAERPTYVASRSNKWFVVSQNREQKAYDSIGSRDEAWQRVWPFVQSPNGKRLAYVAVQGEKERVVVDGNEDALYDEIKTGLPVFSPDSKHLAYTARRRDKAVIVVDSKEVAQVDEVITAKPWPSMVGLWFSPNGKRLAYTVKISGKWFVFVDGIKSPAWDEISDGFGHGFPEGDFAGIRFSADSKHYVYEAKRNGAYSIIVDGVEKAQGELVGCLLFSPDSRRTAYVQLLKEGNSEQWKTFVVLDGVMDKPFDGSVEKMFFNPDSKRLFYLAREGHMVEQGKESLVVNGVPDREYDAFHFGYQFPVFSPDGRGFAYIGERGGENFLVLDGREQIQIQNAEVNDFVFSPDGKHWAAFLMADGEIYAVVDGRRIGPYGKDNATWSKQIVFSPDSRHYAFQAYRGSWQGCLVVDGAEQKINAEWLIGSQLIFDSPTRLHGLIMRGDQLLRLEAAISR